MIFLDSEMIVVLETSRHHSRGFGTGHCTSWKLDVSANPKNYFSFSYLGVLSFEANEVV